MLKNNIGSIKGNDYSEGYESGYYKAKQEYEDNLKNKRSDDENDN